MVAVAAAVLALGASAAGAAPVTQPDITGGLPAGPLSPVAQRAALPGTIGSRARAAAGESSATVGTLTFNVYPFTVAILPPGSSTLFFASGPVIPLVDTGLEDADGVRMVMIDGQEYNHVSAQARYGLDNINAYRATGDPTYLTRAETQAQRLIERATPVGDAWFHRYDFVWGDVSPPWYSGLGQGYALSLFVRLYELTGDAAYKTAADATFASFLAPGPAGTPWVTDVDTQGYLWFQEYPGSKTESVLNGFLVAALGMYDYYRVTGDPAALDLFRGAATTVADCVVDYRQAGWRTLYCQVDPLTADAGYHEVVVQQLLALFSITGDIRFARWADTFESDFPRPIDTTATVAAGPHSALLSRSSTAAVRQVTFSPKAAVHPRLSSRIRLHGRPGYWLLVAAGRWKGCWVCEQWPRAFAQGQAATLDYSPTRTLSLTAGGSFTFHDYSPTGGVLSTTVLRTGRPLTLQIDERAVLDGLTQVRVSGGPFDGCWLRLSGCRLS